MDATLTDRYIDAAMRTVPEAQRADLAAELRASITDDIEARTDEGEAQDAAEVAVLTALGDPDKLAAGYTDRPLWLIGPRYYLDWLRLLKVLLWIVLPFAAIGIAIGNLLAGLGDTPPDALAGRVIAAVVVGMLTAAMHVFFWTTLIFVILERTGQKTMTGEWTVDRLPEASDRGIGLGDLIASLAFLLIMAGAVVWDHLLGLAYVSEQWMPTLAPSLWPLWITLLFVLMGAEALLAITVYARRGWSMSLAVTNVVLNLAIAVPALWLLFDGALVNPALTSALEETAGEAVVRWGVIVIAVAIAGIAVWDSIDVFRKLRRAGRA